MPELPEVETVRRDLEKYLLGAQFQKIEFFDFKNTAPSAAFLAKKLSGLKIVGLERRGKLLILKLESELKKNSGGLNLLIHLKMTGQLIYQDKKGRLAGGHSLSSNSFSAAVGGEELPNKFTRVHFHLRGNRHLFFNDLRKFAYLKLLDDEKLEEFLQGKYGPEPLSKEFNLNFFRKLLSERKSNIKALLLKQELIAGLGNIYVDEALFLSGIDPNRQAQSLDDFQVSKLYQAIKKVLRRAIELRGTTFNDFVDVQGRPGNFSNYLQVYGRQGKSCLKCSRPIKKIKLAGRGTHYCPHCQR